VKADRPAGVTAIAGLFLLAAIYLLLVGLVMLASPGLVSMAAGADLLGGLEVAGPYMFLLMAAAGTAIGLGLLRRHNWARRLTIVIAMIGIVLLVPTVSRAVEGFRIGKLGWGGLGMIVRVMIVWYLHQPHVKEVFEAK
jgi:cell division protein FtsW (lipid II flippase)